MCKFMKVNTRTFMNILNCKYFENLLIYMFVNSSCVKGNEFYGTKKYLKRIIVNACERFYMNNCT